MKNTSTQLSEIKNGIKHAIVNIKIIGVGGGGNNVVKRIAETSDLDIDLIAVNTDRKQLSTLTNPKIRKIAIGQDITKGLGCGGNVELAKQTAENSYDELKEAIKGADLVFLTAGLGAGTGTGALPVIAKIARELDILSVGVVTVPFKFEGPRKMKIAKQAIEELSPYMDALIAVHNDNLLKIKTNFKLTVLTAFKMADAVLQQGIRCVTELILTVGVINVDFADVKSIFTQSTHPDALLGIGESTISPMDAVKDAINSPLVERSIKGARGIILNISGNTDLKLYEVHEATQFINDVTHPDVNVILGTVVDEKMGDKLRATIIATDFADSQPIKPLDEKSAKEQATTDELTTPSFMNKHADGSTNTTTTTTTTNPINPFARFSAISNPDSMNNSGDNN